MNPVVHFEMPAKDLNRVVEFYKNAFNWHMNMMGAEMGNYILATTTETNDKGMPKNPGAINGGFYKEMDDPSINVPSVVISVENISQAMENVKTAGGTILGETMDIPGVGTYVAFRDTEGNRVGMLQPVPMQ